MIGWIITAILKIVWTIFISGPLAFIAGFTKVVNFLTQDIIWKIFFGNQEYFSWSNIPKLFFIFVILAGCIITLIFIIQFITLLFHEESKMKHSVIKSIKMSAFAGIFVLFIPIGYFMLNSFITFIIGILNSNLIDGSSENGLAGLLWYIGDPSWDGISQYQGDLSEYPDNLSDYNFLVEIFAVWFSAFTLVMIVIALIQKIFEGFFLFIIGPVVAATMPLDDGKRMMLWKDYVIQKSLASITSILTFYIYIKTLPLIFQTTLQGMDSLERTTLSCLIIFAFGIGVHAVESMVESLIGESSGLKRGASALASTGRALGAIATGGSSLLTEGGLKATEGAVKGAVSATGDAMTANDNDMGNIDNTPNSFSGNSSQLRDEQDSFKSSVKPKPKPSPSYKLTVNYMAKQNVFINNKNKIRKSRSKTKK